MDSINRLQANNMEKNAPPLDFTTNPEVITAIVEADRLQLGYMYNPVFATEISQVDPLPHQRVAVYEHLLVQSPLRFLLADDAGAGKTIMTGLYLREVFARQLIKRVLIVPPAGLLGNWERELNKLFRLPFRVVNGQMAKRGNPFVGEKSNLLIISVDTLAREQMFFHLRDSVLSGEALPYDLVVFDEAHKLAADKNNQEYIRRTERYRLAEALSGIQSSNLRWELGWSARNILLLTATPHMGKDFPYYCLWRLLNPHALSTFEAFQQFTESQRKHHFLRRTKEEMVNYDGKPIFPKRKCDTLKFNFNTHERELYEDTTKYISNIYNRANQTNRQAAKFAMTVFQRRQASSTYALNQSFARRITKLKDSIDSIESGEIATQRRTQDEIARKPDLFETTTADEDFSELDDIELHENYENSALGGFVSLDLNELQQELIEVEKLFNQSQELLVNGEDSKFERFRSVLMDSEFKNEKFIVFTEHKDTAVFLVRRLESLGYTGQVSLIHGGLAYVEREVQVEKFRKHLDQEGSNYLIATDAAGEGINLQFCHLMINYDIPWNPARLEQRMGRIHRYGQKKNPVIVNLVAGETREGRVIEKLLEKLELIRSQLNSDKVFDVIGKIFNNVSLTSYLEKSLTEDGAAEAVAEIDSILTEKEVEKIENQDVSVYGKSVVRDKLPKLNNELEREPYRRLLPGYVRRFVETSAPLLDLSIRGNPEDTFEFVPNSSSLPDSILFAFEDYPAELQGRLTLYRPDDNLKAIWMHPGELVFDRFCNEIRERWAQKALRGAIFYDPHTKEPYLFHLARISVVRRKTNHVPIESVLKFDSSGNLSMDETVEVNLIGLRQNKDGEIKHCQIEHLLLLRGASDIAPGSIPLARDADNLVSNAEDWISKRVMVDLVAKNQELVKRTLSERINFVSRGFNLKDAELMKKRQKIQKSNDISDEELEEIKAEQQENIALKKKKLQLMVSEVNQIQPGNIEMLAHALVLPTHVEEEKQSHDKNVEKIAMEFARAHEESLGAEVRDVSTPELARASGLDSWPGFDLLSIRPSITDSSCKIRNIEVKGRSGMDSIEISANEWASACNLREKYWLYAVFNCATSQPVLVKVCDPIGCLLAKSKQSMVISCNEITSAAAEE